MRVPFDHRRTARAQNAKLCVTAPTENERTRDAQIGGSVRVAPDKDWAFMALDRLRDPDRFDAWLGGIIRNVHRAAGRQEPLMLLAEWPEGLHPVSAQGLACRG